MHLRKGLQLAVAPDQRGEPALLGHLQPGSAADFAHQDIRAHRFCLPLDLKLTKIVENEKSISQVLRAPAHNDLPRFREPEEPRREVRRVTHRGVVHPQIFADGADHDEARVDTHAHSKLDGVRPSHVGGERLQLPLDRERRTQRAMGVVLVSDRRPEQRHHAVAEELVDRALVAMHLVQDHLEGAVHDRVDFLGVEAL